jgi:hypothetical protein
MSQNTEWEGKRLTTVANAIATSYCCVSVIQWMDSGLCGQKPLTSYPETVIITHVLPANSNFLPLLRHL